MSILSFSVAQYVAGCLFMYLSAGTRDKWCLLLCASGNDVSFCASFHLLKIIFHVTL